MTDTAAHSAKTHSAKTKGAGTPGTHTLGTKADEEALFARLAPEWAQPGRGAWRVLRSMNEARVGFLLEAAAPLLAGRAGARAALDLGCGGGLASLPLAEAGFAVRAVDPALPEALPRHPRLAFARAGLEAESKRRARYDLIAALEVIEHMEDAAGFTAALARLLKPGGRLVVSTLNRTPASWAGGIFLPERVLGLVPTGTHKWRDFVAPEELQRWGQAAGLEEVARAGLWPAPWGGWRLSKSRWDCNYIAAFAKTGRGAKASGGGKNRKGGAGKRRGQGR